MKRLCLPKLERDKLLKALKSGEVSIDSLYNITDTQRNEVFKKYVGEDFASLVNAKFEQAMLSNQKKAFSKWIIDVMSAKDPIRRNMIKKVDRIKDFLTPDKELGFLKDLAEQKLGINVTQKEAKTILNLKEKIDELKILIPTNSPKRSIQRLAYGFAVDDFKQFVGKLKLKAESIDFKEFKNPKNWGRGIVDLASISKSVVATLDNSFLGRQGIKVLLDGKYSIWANTFVESFKNIGKELMTKHPGFFKEPNDSVMRSIRADVYSRPNALNGKYNAAKNGYGLGIIHEEVFPESGPGKTPFLLGRIFKASETAFNGSALRMRADLADAIIAANEKNGIDMLDERQASSFGKLIASKTGRGEIGKVAAIGKELNVLMFSPRFLKSNFDTLTAHLFDKTMTPEAKKDSAISTLRIAMSITALLAIAKLIDPDSIDFDSRSGRFGKIRIFNHDIDITGGMGGFVTLGSRLVPTYHNGEWGFWRKSASTGKYTKSSLVFGEQTALDVFENFFEGKLSPAAGLVRDVWAGQNFQGEKPTFLNSLIGLITPISANMLSDELKKGNDDILFAMIAESLGFSSTDTTFRGYGKRWEKLLKKKGETIYNESLKQVTDNFNKRAENLQSSPSWNTMNNEKQSQKLDKIREQETNKIFDRYGL